MVGFAVESVGPPSGRADEITTVVLGPVLIDNSREFDDPDDTGVEEVVKVSDDSLCVEYEVDEELVSDEDFVETVAL